MKRVYLLILFLTCGICSYAQVKFLEESKIQTLMKQYEEEGMTETAIEGWRIKLISTTDRRKFEKAETTFRNLYPERQYSKSYENPYYSLKVGAFETRYDVEPHLQLLKELFDEAIPFRDRIEKKELFESP